MAFEEHALRRAGQLIEACRARGLTLTTAESCTGGLVAALLTEIPGSSAVVERGFVTYSNAAKSELLLVPAAMLLREGAVSRAVAEAMAQGALEQSHADMAVSVTGIAGPGGGTAAKPVGLVHFAARRRDGPVTHVERRFGDIGRSAIRDASVLQAIALLEAQT